MSSFLRCCQRKLDCFTNTWNVWQVRAFLTFNLSGVADAAFAELSMHIFNKLSADSCGDVYVSRVTVWLARVVKCLTVNVAFVPVALSLLCVNQLYRMMFSNQRGRLVSIQARGCCSDQHVRAIAVRLAIPAHSWIRIMALRFLFPLPPILSSLCKMHCI